MAGLRIANIDQDYDIVAQNETGTFEATVTKFQSNELTGAGPKLAADFNWRLGSFTLGGGGAGALIVANRDYSLRQSAAVNLPGFVPLVGYNSDETVLIPVLNAKSEVAWHFSEFRFDRDRLSV